MNTRKLDPDYELYVLNSDEIAGGANKVMLDLFNAQPSASDVYIFHIEIVPKTDVAVTGAVSARFNINKTTSRGTGGTGHSYKGGSPTALNIVPLDSFTPALSPHITARSAPTGGAAMAEWITTDYVFPEETNTAAIVAQGRNILRDTPQIDPLILHLNEGIVVYQGSVASVNSYSICIVFGVVTVQHA